MTSERINIDLTATDSATPALMRLNNQLNRTKQTADDMSGSSGIQNINDQFDQMSNAMNATFAGASLAGLGQLAGELNRVGMEAQATEAVFTAMAGSVGNSTTLLDQLRSATGNVVSDMDLMSGAGNLMKMGLAEGNEEVTRLMELAIKLKQPSETITESIGNMGAMLANLSYERLDSLGISSGRVRQRVQELKDEFAGMSTEEAFAQAFIEEATKLEDALGSAAEASFTAFGEVSAHIQNATNELGKFVATAIEAGSQLLLLPSKMAALDAKRDAEAYAEKNNLDPNNLTYDQTTVGLGFLGDALGIDDIILSESGRATNPIDLAQVMNTPETLRAAAQELQARAFIENSISSASGFFENDTMGQALYDFGRSYSLKPDQPFVQGTARYGELQNMAYTGRGNMGLMSEESINGLIAGYEQMKSIAEDVAENPFLTQSEVDLMNGMVEGASQLKDEAIAAKEAFESMSLGQMLGRGDGGRAGELSDMVLGNMEQDQRDAVQTDFDLATGRETELGMAVEQKIAPQIAEVTEKLGSEVGISAMEAALEAIEQGQVAGNTDAQIASSAQFAVVQQLPFFQGMGDTLGGMGEGVSGFFGGMMGGEGMGGQMLGEGEGPFSGEMLNVESTIEGLDQVGSKIAEISEVAGQAEMSGLVDSGNQVASVLSEALGIVDSIASDREVTVTVNIKKGSVDPEAESALGKDISGIVNNNGGQLPE